MRAGLSMAALPPSLVSLVHTIAEVLLQSVLSQHAFEPRSISSCLEHSLLLSTAHSATASSYVIRAWLLPRPGRSIRWQRAVARHRTVKPAASTTHTPSPRRGGAERAAASRGSVSKGAGRSVPRSADPAATCAVAGDTSRGPGSLRAGAGSRQLPDHGNVARSMSASLPASWAAAAGPEEQHNAVAAWACTQQRDAHNATRQRSKLAAGVEAGVGAVEATAGMPRWSTSAA